MADGKIVIDVVLDDGSVAKGVADVSGALNTVSDGLEKSRMTALDLAASLGLVAAAKKGFSMLSSSIGTATKRIDTFEQFGKIMNIMIGDTKAVEKAMDDMGEIVAGTAYTLDGAALAVQNYVTRGAELEDAVGYVEAWGDAVAFYGDGSQTQFDNVTSAIQTMLATGKTDLRQIERLVSAGIPAVDIYADKVGMSTDKVSEMLSSGEIDVKDFIDTVTEAMMEGGDKFPKIAGAAKEAGATWGATMDIIKSRTAIGMQAVIESIDETLQDNGLPHMREMLMDFGTGVRDVLIKLSEAIPKAVDFLIDLYKTIEPFVPILIPIVSGILGFVFAVASMNSIIGIINTVRGSFQALFGVLMGNPIGIVIAVVAGLVTAGIALYKNWDKIKEKALEVFPGLTPIFETIESVFSGLKDKVGKIVENIVKFFKDLPEKLNEAKEFMGKIIKNFEPTLNVIKSAFKSLLSHIGPIIDNLKMVWEGLKPVLTTVAKLIGGVVVAAFTILAGVVTTVITTVISVIGPLINVITSLASIVTNAFGFIISLLKGDFAGAWEHLKNIGLSAGKAFLGVFETIIKFISSFVSSIITFFKDLFMTLVGNSIIPDMIEAIIEWFKSLPGKVLKFISDFVESAIEWFVDLYESAIEWVGELVDGIIEWFSGLYDSVIEWVSGLVEGVVEWFNDLLENTDGIFGEILEFIGEVVENIYEVVVSYFEAISEFISLVFETVSEIITAVWEYIKETFQNALDFIVSLVTLDFEGMKEAISNQMENARELISRVWEAIKEFFSEILQKIWDTITRVFNNIRESITEVINNIRERISNTWDKILTIISDVVGNIRDTISRVFNRIKNTVSRIVGEIKDSISKTFNSLKEVTSEAFDKVKSAVSDGIKGALKKVTGMASEFLDAGKEIVSNIAKGIKNSIGKVTGAASEVAAKVRGFFPFSPPKEGPLKDIMDVAWGETIGAGIEKGEKKAKSSMNRLTKSLLDAYDGGLSDLDINTLEGLQGANKATIMSKLVVPRTKPIKSGPTKIINTQEYPEPEVKVITGDVIMDGRTTGQVIWREVKDNIDRDEKLKKDFSERR